MRVLLFTMMFLSSLLANEFIDVTLKDYVQIVSKQKNISIVLDNNIDTKYSIFLSTKVPESAYYEILENILRKNNLKLERNKTHYFITKRTKETSNKNRVFIYKFSYIGEEEIKGLMQLYNYTYNYVKNLKTIFIDCTKNDYENLKLIFKEFDKIPNQSKLKITILDTNLTKMKEYGVENQLNIKSSGSTSFFFNLLAFPFSSSNTITNLDKTNFTSFIKFMNSKNITTILSSPTISIYDNKKSLFEVVRNIPYKTGETLSEEDITKTTTSINYKDVGLKLEVTPIINENQAFIDFSLTIENIIDKSETPTTSKRHFKQYISLNKNELFILNGINQTETFIDEYKTPLLSDIPLVNWLFKKEVEDIKTSNLTIMLELI